MFLSLSKPIIAAVIVSVCAFHFTEYVAQQQGKDACHVYVVDVAKSRRAFDTYQRTGDEERDAKALLVGQTIFPEFRPEIDEEALTTKHYPFPNSKLIITASVFYTDESMGSPGYGEFKTHYDSMLIGVTVSRRGKNSAIEAGNNAVAEVTYDEYANKVRAKKYVTVNGRLHLVGIECDCMANKRPR